MLLHNHYISVYVCVSFKGYFYCSQIVHINKSISKNNDVIFRKIA